MSDKITLIQDLQMELYRLFTSHIFSLTGIKTQSGEDNLPEELIAKSQIVDASLKLLNDFGESLLQDERLVKNDNND
jgi:hypothetical protein